VGRDEESDAYALRPGSVANEGAEAFPPSYTGGVDIVDFTNPRNPSEPAFYYTAASGTLPAANTWSHYWYENQPGDDNAYWSYGNDIPLGSQVFRTEMRAVDVALTRLNPQTQEDLISCRVTPSPTRLRARPSRTVRATVRIAPGVAIVPGQAAADVAVRFRGPGISATVRANAAGVARIAGVSPTRRGRLTVSVPSVPNMTGCRATARIAAAPRPRVGLPLTGRAR
jgi:hypothetical protein